MNWKITVFWSLILLGLLCFFCLYDPFLFSRQEEVQLFIPEWYLVKEKLLTPGGFCSFIAQFLVQFYPDLFAAVLINTVIYFLIGVLLYLLLQRIESRRYNLPLSLIPVLSLLKTQLNPACVLDGAVGILCLLFFLYISILIVKKGKGYVIVGVITILLYFLLGQLAVLYGILFLLFCCVTKRHDWYYAVTILFLGVLFNYAGISMALYVPLTDGIYSLRYQESQFLPESFLYYMWIRLVALIIILSIIVYLLRFIPLKKKTQSRLLTAFAGLLVIGYSVFCFPDSFDRQNRIFSQLAYMKNQQDWNGIIRLSREKYNAGHIGLNYLNMALMKKGELADKLFMYDQNGAQSLIAPWDGTYYTSILLSDIHYMIGDVSVSESYAMEALTLAKRGGSPRALKRLVELNLMKGDIGIVKKYTGILRQMPGYRSWAEEQEKRLSDPDGLCRTVYASDIEDRLLSALDTESLWKGHLNKESFNEVAFEYLACSYLLAKDVAKLKMLLDDVYDLYINAVLPVHFQEAMLIWAFEDESSVPDSFPVEEKYKARFENFRRDFKREALHQNGYTKMRQQYGDTFWFYYYCKQI